MSDSCKFSQVMILCMFIMSIIQNSVTWKIVLFCESDMYDVCQAEVDRFESDVENDATNTSAIHVSSTGNFITDVDMLSKLVSEDPSVITLASLGSDHVSSAATCVSRGTNIPSLVYSTSYHRKPIYSETVIQLHPDHAGLARAMVTLIGSQIVDDAYVICEDSFVTDGFLAAFDQHEHHSLENKSHQLVMSKSISDLDLRLRLLFLHDNGFRLIIVHASHMLFGRIVTVASDLKYFDIGYAWLVTEEALPRDPVTPNVSISTKEQTPKGLLAMDGHEVNKYPNLIQTWLQVVRNATGTLIKESSKYGLSVRYLSENLRIVLSSRADVSSAFKRSITSNTLLFDSNGRRKDMQYRLLNFAKGYKTELAYWLEVGFITNNHVNLKTVVWPGRSIFEPMGVVREYLTVITRPAEPFLYTRGPVQGKSDCVADTACLKMFTSRPIEIVSIIDAFKYDREPEYKSYEIHCCEGLVVDILHSLTVQLKMEFMLYFTNDSDYGQYINGSWTGMIGDITRNVADVMAGAVTITSDRMEALTFTEAFYFSSFNMIASSDDRYTSLLAFLNPFHYTVWITLIASATSVALATSLFEWNSPFGLNPWGKCRKKNYTLGSALTMVYSIWFGHTVITKSPKSWPSKWLQNCWSALAIFTLAAYTANLAAFLAGSAYVDGSYSILDSQLSSKRVGVTRSSAVEAYIKTINTDLHTRFRKHYVNDIEDAFTKLRTDQLDLYMDDSPILEYALSKFDDNCSIKYAAHHFGENSYAFGLPKGSWLKAQFDPLILNYVEMGFVEDLKWRYMGRNRQCNNMLVYADREDMKFGLQHTGGLFIMLLTAIGVSICLLVMEHVTYFVITPWLRKKHPDSIWKNRNVEYFSQRLYKAINSEKIDPHVKVLISKVKERKFHIQNRLKRQAVSVPANLTNYTHTNRPFTNILNGLYKNYYEAHNFNIEDDIFTISDAIDNESDAINTHLHRLNSQFSIRSGAIAYDLVFDNPVFKADDSDVETDKFSIINEAVRRSSHDIEQVLIHNTLHMKPKSGKFDTLQTNKRQLSERLPNKRGRRYETWPSPQTKRKRSLKKNNGTLSFSNADRKVSIVSENRIVNDIPINASPSCRKCSSASLDSYSQMSAQDRRQRVRFDMKDNRMKSSLRHHAMASIEPSTSGRVDACAVEALSKEDLLVLWKRSEIELQTKLNRIIHQNNHLRQLVNIVEESQGNHGNNDDCEDEDVPPTDSQSTYIVSTRL